MGLGRLKKIKIGALILGTIICLIVLFLFPHFSEASISKTFNYQGRLTDASDVNVADGAYDMVFKVYTVAGGGSAAWTESWTSAALWTETGATTISDGNGSNGCPTGTKKIEYTTGANESSMAAGQILWNTTIKESATVESVTTGSNIVCVYTPASTWTGGDDLTNRIYVKGGIFSASLGTVTAQTVSFTSGDYYLGVKIGTDSEMMPRKKLTSVPQALNANNLVGDGYMDLDTVATTQDAVNVYYNPTSGANDATEIIYGSGGGTGTALNVTQAGSGFALRVNDDGTATDTTPFVINTDGNVGIGTTVPSVKLELKASAVGDGILLRESYAGNSALFQVAQNSGDGTGATLSLSDGTGTDKVVITSGTGNVYFNGGGNVGIGLTNPSYKLDVSSSVDNYLQSIYNTNTGSSAGGLYIRSDGTGNLLTLNSAGSDIMTVTAAQTTFNNPVAMTSAGDVSMAYDLYFTNSSASYIKYQGPGYIQTESPYQNLNLTLSAANLGEVIIDDEIQITGARLNVNSNGNVGIGTTAPIAQLHLVKADSSALTDVLINPTVKTSGNLIDAQVGGASKFTVDYSGYGYFLNYVKVGSATTGYQLGSSGWIRASADGVFRLSNNADNNFSRLNFGGVTSSFPALAVNGSDLQVIRADGSTNANLLVSGSVGIGVTAPTAVLHLKAGTTAAGTAPLKFTTGANTTAAVAGQMEYDGAELYFTPVSTRETIAYISDITGASHNAVTLAAIGSTPNANGMTLSTQVLNLQPADGTYGGVVSTTTQTFAGAKTFTGTATFSNGTYSALFTGGNVGIGTTAPGAKLHVYDTAGGSNNFIFETGASAGFGALMVLRQDSASPAANDDIARLNFNGRDSAGNWTEYAGIYSSIETATDGSEGGRLKFFTSETTTGSLTERMRINQNGNVGIGTTGPIGSTYDSVTGGAPAVKLDISGGSVHLASPYGLYIGDEGTANAGGAHINYDATANTLTLAGIKQGSGYANILLAPTQGNIGIGTTAPGAKLEINGFTAIKTIGDAGLNIDSTDNNSPYVQFLKGSAGKWAIGVERNSGVGWGAASNDLVFYDYTGTVGNRMVIKSTTGNVGIGTTNPGAKLETYVQGGGALPATSGTAEGIGLIQRMQDNSTAVLDIGLSGGSGAWINVANVGNLATHYSLLLNPNGGNVGIGTTNPGQKLDVSINVTSNGSPALRLSNLASGGEGAALEWFSGYGSKVTGQMYSQASGSNGADFWVNLLDQTSATLVTRLKIDNSGNVGIGTTSPLQKLHVNGQCMTGDTLLPIRRRRRRKKLSDGDADFDPEFPESDFDENNPEYDYLFCPIRDILPGDEVLSLDEATNTVVYKKINALLDMGEKEIYEIKTKSGRVIRTTANHPYLVKMQNSDQESNGNKVENSIKNLFKKALKYITIRRGSGEICETRDITPLQNRDMNLAEPTISIQGIQKKIEEITKTGTNLESQPLEGSVLKVACPYCQSENYVKRGLRKKKLEVIQLYLCNDCRRTFTPKAVKGKRYPLSIILNAISLYNLGYSLEKVCEALRRIMGEKEAAKDILFNNNSISPSTVSAWIRQFGQLCRFLRFRDYAMQKFRIKDFIETATLAHRQLYRFRYHRAKMAMMLQDDIRHFKYKPLQEFLESVAGECPHQYFQDGLRASEAPLFFSKKEMIVRGKENYATRLAKFVLESVGKNKDRHEALQKFMLINDSVTVATEVPVYIRAEDLTHMKTQLGFQLYSKPDKRLSKKNSKGEDELLQEITSENIPKLITGHIDILQVRNGLIHILDFKPKAEKERPVEQLVLYALALSRLTGLRLFNFKCAWFDEKDYFEFFPLHAVYKPGRRRKKVQTIEGEYFMNKRDDKFESIRAGGPTAEKRGPPKLPPSCLPAGRESAKDPPSPP